MRSIDSAIRSGANRKSFLARISQATSSSARSSAGSSIGVAGREARTVIVAPSSSSAPSSRSRYQRIVRGRANSPVISGLCLDQGRTTSMTGYQPSASIASSASHRSVTAARICAGRSRSRRSPSRSSRLASVRRMAEIDLTDRTDPTEHYEPGEPGAREILTWEKFGIATRELATEIARRRVPARHRARDRARRAHRRRRARVRALGEELLRDERGVLHERRRTARRSRRVAADARPRSTSAGCAC